MASFSISSRGQDPVEVEASNWIAALGLGLEVYDQVGGLERLACEVLPNGTVIARDVGTGTGYIVQCSDPLASTVDGPTLEPVEPSGGVLEAIGEADTPSSAASLALTLVREEVPGESGAVLLADRGYLRFVSVVGPHSRRLMGVRLPIGTGVAGFCMEKKRTVVLDDAHTDSRHCGEVDALTGYVTRQIAVVPVVAGNRCFGVIELMNPPEGEGFGEEHVAVIQRAASALAARLLDQ